MIGSIKTSPNLLLESMGNLNLQVHLFSGARKIMVEDIQLAFNKPWVIFIPKPCSLSFVPYKVNAHLSV